MNLQRSCPHYFVKKDAILSCFLLQLDAEWIEPKPAELFAQCPVHILDSVFLDADSLLINLVPMAHCQDIVSVHCGVPHCRAMSVPGSIKVH